MRVDSIPVGWWRSARNPHGLASGPGAARAGIGRSAGKQWPGARAKIAPA